jgi:quaternary ammonium compound-resistance protein SugE
MAIITSLGLLGITMRTLPTGTAYAIWVGIKIIDTVIFGMLFLGESANMLRILGLVFIVTGIIFLMLSNQA